MKWASRELLSSSCAPALPRWNANTAPTHMAGSMKKGNTYATANLLRMNARPSVRYMSMKKSAHALWLER